ncbi:MAG: choice-of-anchor D domain-containing protein, partial [Pirellulales bacterium]
AGAAATTGTVSRNTDPTDALVVTLSGDDAGEADVPQQVTIPAGAASVEFDIDAVDDAIVDGTQTVVFTANAAGHVPDAAVLEVTDDDTAASEPEIKVLTFSGAPLVIDDGDAGYGTVRNWIPFTGAGHQNDLDYNAAGFGNDVATWTFDGLTPGEYRVSATWVPYANRATDAPYTVLNGGAALKTVNVNQELPPNDFNDLGSSWEDLGFFTITGDTLVVELSDDANGYVIADAIRIEKLAGIEDGAGKVDFGGTDVDSAVQQTFTVLNEGIANLTLSEPIELPAGYSVASGFGSTTLPPGAETTFTIQLDAAVDGTFAGNISFGNNDGDENPFDIAVTGSVNPPPAVTILDDGDAGFASGGFNSFAGLGFQNDIHYAAPNSGKTASWNFSGLVPGVYTVATTWSPHPNRATNAAYSIDRGAPILVNQELPPAADAVESGAAFQNLAAGYVVAGGTLTVGLTAIGANDYIIADAIRLERAVGPAEIQVLDGGTNVDDGGEIRLGTIPIGAATVRTFTVANIGGADLTLGELSVPDGFSVAAGLGSTPLAPGQKSTFQIQADATTLGNFSGNVSFANNDDDENPFDFTIFATVADVQPEIEVLNLSSGSPVAVEDGAGTVDFGGTEIGAAVQQTFAVRNEGIANLTLSEPIGLPAGYSVASGFGSTTLPPGAETTFTIQLDAAADGTFAGNISFGNNDGDEHPFDIAVTGSVNPPPAVTILDDGDAGFASGGFTPFVGLGFQNDMRYSGGNSGKTASWNFSGLVPGVYTIATTWSPHPNRATNAAYAIDRGAPIIVNQELPPAADAVESGAAFQNLATGYVVAGGTLTVSLTAIGANEYVIADAVRLERAVGPAEIQVLDGGTNVDDGGGVSLGTVPVGAATVRTFTVVNIGGADLTLGELSVPTGFSVAAGFGSNSLTPGQQSTFQIQADATTEGDFGGNISFANNDDDENPFDFTISATVAAVQPEIKVLGLSGAAVVIDDGDGGYNSVGSWGHFIGDGQQNDLDFNAAGAGTDVATWTFGGLTPGSYRVSATWTEHPNRATDAPYTVLDGGAVLSTVDVNQELPPNDFNDLGSGWEDLGLFTIAGDTLVVRLSDDADQYVIADAIRIEELADIDDGAGTIDFGGTEVGAAVQRAFTVLNAGTSELTLSEPIGLPAGYSVASGFGSTTLPPGAQTSFTVQLDAAADGTFAGDISFGNNDGDEHPFDIAVTGSVDPPAVVSVLDDGDAGFASGGFTLFTGLGFQNDMRYSAANSGKTASWNFSGLVPGVYSVAA